jgi:hypothetical protein
VPDADEAAVARDEVSIRRYGRRQEPLSLPNASEEDTPGRALRHAQGRVAVMAQPRLRANGTALDLEPARFRDYAVGSRVMIEAAAPVPFFQPVTVLGLDYVPSAGTLGLVFDDQERMGEIA